MSCHFIKTTSRRSSCESEVRRIKFSWHCRGLGEARPRAGRRLVVALSQVVVCRNLSSLSRLAPGWSSRRCLISVDVLRACLKKNTKIISIVICLEKAMAPNQSKNNWAATNKIPFCDIRKSCNRFLVCVIWYIIMCSNAWTLSNRSSQVGTTKKEQKKRLKTRCQDLVSVLNAAPYEVAVEISETVWVGGPEIEKTWC